MKGPYNVSESRAPVSSVHCVAMPSMPHGNCGCDELKTNGMTSLPAGGCDVPGICRTTRLFA